MATKKYVQALTQYLAGSGVLVGATTITLTSLTDIYGNAISAITPFGDKGYITLEPDSVNEEAATFTSVTVNANGTVTLGGVSTALAQSPYTETSGLIRAHSGGTKLVITDNVAFWNTFANVNNLNTFVILPQSAATPTATSDLTTKTYVDTVAIQGAPNATTSVQGLLQLPTQAQVLAKTATGSTGAALAVTPALLPSTLLSDYKVDTGSANAYAIAPAPAITAYVVGQVFSFKAVHANTTASTLAVNGLTATAIVKSDASALVANDILAGQIVVVEYDGTSFQLISNSGILTADGLKSATTVVSVSAATAPTNTQVLTATSGTTATWQTPIAAPVYKNGTNTSWTMGTASGTQNIAHGLGVIPKNARLAVTVSGSVCIGYYNGTTASFVSLVPTSSNPATSGSAGTSIFVTEEGASPHIQTGVVTFDDTNIIITWTLSGTNGSDAINIAWEATV